MQSSQDYLVVETSSGKPYTQQGDERTFYSSVAHHELVWHRDKYDREITILEGENWQLQLDNELPVTLERGKLYKIPKMKYHRVIKGSGHLKIKIWEDK